MIFTLFSEHCSCFKWLTNKRNISFLFFLIQLDGGMLLQYLLFSSITELIAVVITISWIVRALYHPEPKEESKQFCFWLTDQDKTASAKTPL